MKMDMIGYIKKFGNDSFDDYPLNEIDSMILCQLTYFDFSNTPVCNTDLNYTLKEFLNNDYQKTRVKGIWNPKKNDLFARVLKSARRYYSMHIGFYSSIIDKETEKQFSACTFQLSSGLYYICYRGTDASFVGWKEDFNLGYLENIPSQIMAVTYFENFVRDYPGKYYIGGHSKGGNLAIYAGVMCKQDYQSEIITIFNHDGPGFLPDFYQKVEYGMIKEKIEKTIPKESIVGLLLEQSEDYKIVSSKSILLLQHDLFKWEIEENHLKYVQNVTKFSKHTRNSVNNWIMEMDVETREVFINTIYSLITETNAEYISQFLKHGIKNIFIMHKKLKGLDPIVKKTIKKVLNGLYSNYKKSYKHKGEKEE